MNHSGRRVTAAIVVGILVAATATTVVGVTVNADPASSDSPDASPPIDGTAATDAPATTEASSTTAAYSTTATDSTTGTHRTIATNRTTDTTESTGPVSVTEKLGVRIEFACDSVRVSVPDGVTYSLIVHYFVSETGEYDWGLLGPLEGSVEEPFDDEIVFFEVNVFVRGRVVISGFIPESCPNAPGLAFV